MATGDVVAYLNAGDIFHEHAFRVASQVMKTQGVSWICGYHLKINEARRSHRRIETSPLQARVHTERNLSEGIPLRRHPAGRHFFSPQTCLKPWIWKP